MIDYFWKWNSEIAAMQDAKRLAKYLGMDIAGRPLTFPPSSLPPIDVPQAKAILRGEGRMQVRTEPWFDWGLFRVLPNVQAWRISQDVFSNDSPPVFLRHTYLAGWFAILAMEETLNVLLNDNNLAFALNRNWTRGASPPNLIVKNNIGAVIQDIGVSPVFAGSDYPIGGWST